MLPDFGFLLAVLLGLGMLAPGPYDPLLALGGTIALTVVSVALVWMSVERALRALESNPQPQAALARASLLSVTPLLAWWVSLTAFHYGQAIDALLPPGLWLLRYVPYFLPVLVGFGTVWAGRARIEAAVAARQGRARPPVGTRAAVFAGLRRNALALIPLGIVLGLLDGLTLAAEAGVPGCAALLAALRDVPLLRVGFEIGLLAGLTLVFPAVLARVLPGAPFPQGALRERLERLASAIGIRYREMRIWRTGGRGVNAMVVGLTPGTRRIFVTDGLLALMPGPEVEAVFAHEAGHARRHHLVWFLVMTLVVALLFLVLDEPLTRIGLEEGLFRSLLHLGILWFVLLGSVSRHFERESDVDGATYGAALDPAAPSVPVPALPAPLPAGAVRMFSALKRLEAMFGNVYSHRHGTPADRAAYVAHHATDERERAALARRGRRLRVGTLLLLVALLGIAGARLPDDLVLADAHAAYERGHEAYEGALSASPPAGKDDPRWKAALDAYASSAQRADGVARVRAEALAPFAWLGVGQAALRGGDLARARQGLERTVATVADAPLPEVHRRRVTFDALVDLARVALREGRPVAEVDALAVRAARSAWAREGADGALVRARLALLEGALEIASGKRDQGIARLAELARRTGEGLEWAELRADANSELVRALPETPPR